MILAALPAVAPAPAAIVQPGAYQVSFGTIDVRVPAGTQFAVLYVDGKAVKSAVPRGMRATIEASLPLRDVTLRVVALGRGWARTSARVGPVHGLPRAASPRVAASTEDATLARRVRALARGFPGFASAYVQDLRSGAGAAWNARARFPAASALKLAIAVEVLRTIGGPPAHGSSIDALMRSMLVYSDNGAANQLEVAIAGSTSAASARINATMRAIGLTDSDMYGGYALDRAAERPIPVEIDSQPSIGSTKHSTARDLTALIRAVYLATGRKGPLSERVDGFAPAAARYLLYELLHVQDRGKLDRFLPAGTRVAHKAGWIAAARVDNGIVFWAGGAFVAAVMTYGPGVGTGSDILAGRVGRAALERFRALRRGA